MKTNKHKHNNNRLKLLLCVLGIGLIPPLALADVLEEIVVTAQKQEEPLQEVPVSVSALSGDQIDNLGFSDLTDITMQIPSLQLNSWSPQLTIFNLRGVSQNNFVDNLEAPIAVYHDEAYIASINALSGPDIRPRAGRSAEGAARHPLRAQRHGRIDSLHQSRRHRDRAEWLRRVLNRLIQPHQLAGRRGGQPDTHCQVAVSG